MGEKVGKFTTDERGLHFDGTAEEMHAEIETINQPLYWIEEHWRSFLALAETAELIYLRDWFKVEGFGWTFQLWPQHLPSSPDSPAFAKFKQLANLRETASTRVMNLDPATDGDDLQIVCLVHGWVGDHADAAAAWLDEAKRWVPYLTNEERQRFDAARDFAIDDVGDLAENYPLLDGQLMAPVPETPAVDFMRPVLDLRLAAQRRLIEAKASQVSNAA